MNDIDRVISWAVALIVIIGLIAAGLRARNWWRDRIRKDPLEPDPVVFKEERFSLRRDR